MTLILGEGGLIKKFIQPLGPQLGLKISGGGGQAPQAPPLDQPLIMTKFY